MCFVVVCLAVVGGPWFWGLLAIGAVVDSLLFRFRLVASVPRTDNYQSLSIDSLTMLLSVDQSIEVFVCVLGAWCKAQRLGRSRALPFVSLIQPLSTASFFVKRR